MADESKFEQAKGNIKETIGNATNNELEMKVKRIKLLAKRNSLKMPKIKPPMTSLII